MDGNNGVQQEFRRLHERMDDSAAVQSKIQVQVAEISTQLKFLQCSKHDERIGDIETAYGAAGWKALGAFVAAMGAVALNLFQYITHK